MFCYVKWVDKFFHCLYFEFYCCFHYFGLSHSMIDLYCRRVTDVYYLACLIKTKHSAKKNFTLAVSHSLFNFYKPFIAMVIYLTVGIFLLGHCRWQLLQLSYYNCVSSFIINNPLDVHVKSWLLDVKKTFKEICQLGFLDLDCALAFVGLPIVPMLCKNEARAFDPTV